LSPPQAWIGNWGSLSLAVPDEIEVVSQAAPAAGNGAQRSPRVVPNDHLLHHAFLERVRFGVIQEDAEVEEIVHGRTRAFNPGFVVVVLVARHDKRQVGQVAETGVIPEGHREGKQRYPVGQGQDGFRVPDFDVRLEAGGRLVRLFNDDVFFLGDGVLASVAEGHRQGDGVVAGVLVVVGGVGPPGQQGCIVTKIPKVVGNREVGAGGNRPVEEVNRERRDALARPPFEVREGRVENLDGVFLLRAVEDQAVLGDDLQGHRVDARSRVIVDRVLRVPFRAGRTVAEIPVPLRDDVLRRGQVGEPYRAARHLALPIGGNIYGYEPLRQRR
jgi:hypothetical protein